MKIKQKGLLTYQMHCMYDGKIIIMPQICPEKLGRGRWGRLWRQIGNGRVEEEVYFVPGPVKFEECLRWLIYVSLEGFL